MKRYNNNGKSGWGSSRPDTFPNGASRRPQPMHRREFGGFNWPPFVDLEMESRPVDDTQQGDPISLKLDLLMDRFDKFDVWRDETDRRFENLEPVISREAEPPSGYDDGEEYEEDDFRGKKLWDSWNRPRQQNSGRRDGRARSSFAWDQPGVDSDRNRFSGYNQSFNRPASCWDPLQHFH